MCKNFYSLFPIFGLHFIMACGSSQFGGGAGSNPPAMPTTKKNNALTGNKNEGKSEDSKEKTLPEIPAVNSPQESDEKAIARCLVAWGDHPFGDADIKNHRKIYASVSVLGMGNAITDTTVTDKPRLIVVEAGVNVLSDSVYNLKNPNGWYCLKVNVDVMSSLTINLHCKANMSDGMVNVNVMSKGDQAGAVGVDVLSKGHINRTGC